MSGDILSAIDAAVQANLCGCGCGQQIPDRGPSPDFVNEKHQQAWSEARDNPNPRPPGQWLDRLNASITAAATEGDCADDCTGHRWHARITSVVIDEVSTVKLSTMRRALDKIRGIRP